MDISATAVNAVNSVVGTNSRSFYDSKSGTFLLIALALVLWWVPYLGQMIPGYVGGRRAGSMSRGILVSIVGTAVLAGLALGGAVTVSWLLSTPSIMECISSYPALQTVFDYISGYLSTFILITESGFSITTEMIKEYLLMGAFAIVGGAMANQARKEMSIVIGSTMSQTAPKVPRSIKAAAAGRNLNFESYSDLYAISVNSMAVSDARSVKNDKAQEPSKKVQEPAAAQPQADPVPVTTTQVSASVSMPVVHSTTTSSENRVEAREEPEPVVKKTVVEKKTDISSEYEWL